MLIKKSEDESTEHNRILPTYGHTPSKHDWPVVSKQ